MWEDFRNLALVGTGRRARAAGAAPSQCWEFLPFPGLTQEVGWFLARWGSPRKVGEPQEGGGSLGRWGIPRKVGAPQEGWGALAHPGFHGDTKQRMLENLRMSSASHSIPGTCLILGKKGMLIPCSRSFLPEEH